MHHHHHEQHERQRQTPPEERVQLQPPACGCLCCVRAAEHREVVAALQGQLAAARAQAQEAMAIAAKALELAGLLVAMVRQGSSTGAPAGPGCAYACGQGLQRAGEPRRRHGLRPTR